MRKFDFRSTANRIYSLLKLLSVKNSVHCLDVVVSSAELILQHMQILIYSLINLIVLKCFKIFNSSAIFMRKEGESVCRVVNHFTVYGFILFFITEFRTLSTDAQPLVSLAVAVKLVGAIHHFYFKF